MNRYPGLRAVRNRVFWEYLVTAGRNGQKPGFFGIYADEGVTG